MVRTDDTVLLVDCGIAGKRIKESLKLCESDITEVNGILVTHEHIDHVKSIRMMGKQAVNARVFGTKGTLLHEKEKLPEDRSIAIKQSDEFVIGDIKVRSFALSHDAAEPCGFSFEAGGKKLSIVTDTGIITSEIFDSVKNSNALILEANHEVNILRMGPYPFTLQQRILGDFGHLSNDCAGGTLCELLKAFDQNNMPQVMLAHLSKENNTPEQAYITVKNELFEANYYVDRDLSLNVAPRSEPTQIFKVE